MATRYRFREWTAARVIQLHPVRRKSTLGLEGKTQRTGAGGGGMSSGHVQGAPDASGPREASWESMLVQGSKKQILSSQASSLRQFLSSGLQLDNNLGLHAARTYMDSKFFNDVGEDALKALTGPWFADADQRLNSDMLELLLQIVSMALACRGVLECDIVCVRAKLRAC